jgi:hypothetical protein
LSVVVAIPSIEKPITFLSELSGGSEIALTLLTPGASSSREIRGNSWRAPWKQLICLEEELHSSPVSSHSRLPPPDSNVGDLGGFAKNQVAGLPHR